MIKSVGVLAKITQVAARVLHGDLTIFGGPALPETIAGRVRAEQISIVTRYTCAMMVANAFNACVLLVAFWSSPQRGEVMIWSFILVTFSTFVYLKRRTNAHRPKPTSLSERTVRRAVVNASVVSLIWASLPLVFFEQASNDGKLVIICLCIGMLCGGAFTLAPVPVAAMTFLAPLSFAAGYAIVRFDNPVYLLLGALLVVYTFALMRGVVTFACQTTEKAIEHILSEEAAHTDNLTKLPNRVAFREGIDAAFTRTRRYGEGFSVFYFDLDEFKAVNDKFGHSGGDELLRQVAERLQSCTREGDILARLGGDEFALIAARASVPEKAMVVADRILKAFSAAFAIDGRQVYCGVSMGIALVPIDGTDPDAIIEKADSALYATKIAGRASYRFFAREHDEKVRDRRLLEQQLRGAVRNQELHLAFQPLANLKTGRVCGFETLVRWNHPERGPISPAVFIPIAEETGIIQELGEWVIRESVKVASKWPAHLHLAINVSAIQFRTSSLLTILHEVLNEYSVAPGRIEIEITESALIAENESTIGLLNSLRQWGVRIALDDFGTGYSSLRYLLDLPLDKIKIDRSFIATAITRPNSAALVKAVVGLARDLNMVVTAEGIETEEQMAFVKAHNCDEGQGYLISMPRLAADLGPFLQDAEPALKLAS